MHEKVYDAIVQIAVCSARLLACRYEAVIGSAFMFEHLAEHSPIEVLRDPGFKLTIN